MLSKVNIQAGIDKQTTTYGAEGRWIDSKNVRFRTGLPEKIGGWSKLIATRLVGVVRGMKAWYDDGGIRYLAIGTDRKLYVYSEGTAVDITPIRSTATLNGPFTSTGNTTITVAHTSHGATQGDFVTFSGATSVGGQDVNNEYQITSVINANSYTITHNANVSSASSAGGSSVTANYQLNNSANSQNMITATDGGAVTLFTAGAAKLATTSTGIDVTGTTDTDNLTIAGAQGSDGQVLTSTGSGVAWEDASGGGITTEAQVKTDGQTVELALSTAIDHKVTCSGSVTISVTGGTLEGESHTLRIVNSGIATVGFSTAFLFPSGTTPSLPTSDGAISLISFTIHRAGTAGIGTQLLTGSSVNYS